MTLRISPRWSSRRAEAAGSQIDSGMLTPGDDPDQQPGLRRGVARVAPHLGEPAEDGVRLQRLEAEEERHRPPDAGSARRPRTRCSGHRSRGAGRARPARATAPRRPAPSATTDPRPARQPPKAWETGTVSRNADGQTEGEGGRVDARSRGRSGRGSGASPARGSARWPSPCPPGRAPTAPGTKRCRGPATRPPRPITTATRETATARCRPERRANVGASAPKPAKASTGREVSRPASVPDRPSPRRTSARTGPTLTAAGRRLKDRRISPASTRVVRRAAGTAGSFHPGRGRVISPDPAAGGGLVQDERVRHIDDDERRARLGVRHALAAPVADTLAAARAVTCLHATEPASVHLAARARCGATRDEVDAALYDQRSVVKQLAMRRTVFAFPSELLPGRAGGAPAPGWPGSRCAGWPRRWRTPASPRTARRGSPTTWPSSRS